MSAAELQHLRFLRGLLGLPVRIPTAVLLAEAGELPLHVRWLATAARFWNSLVTAPEDSLLQQALQAALALAADSDGLGKADMPWAAQLARSMQLIGVQFDPQQRHSGTERGGGSTAQLWRRAT